MSTANGEQEEGGKSAAVVKEGVSFADAVKE